MLYLGIALHGLIFFNRVAGISGVKFISSVFICVQAKKQLWAAPLCHSLVRYTYVDLLLCCIKERT